MSFLDTNKPEVLELRKLYEAGLSYNERLKLDETVRVNENNYNWKQWDGVQSNGLPTPQINFMQRVVNHLVATISTDNLSVLVTILPSAPDKKALHVPVGIINNEFSALMEQLKVVKLTRRMARDACVRGDGCVYVYWDANAETGQAIKGAIRAEIIKNNRVFFGNPNSQDVQGQPFIILEQSMSVRDARNEAKRNGNPDWELIKADDDNHGVDQAKKTDNKVVVTTLFWKNEGEVYAYRATKSTWVREAWSLGIRLYPLVWFPWSNDDGCYHGQSLISGLDMTQQFINKITAMSGISIIDNAFPRYLYDKTRIKGVDNRVGGAIPVNGGDVNNALKIVSPASMSPQVFQFIESVMQMTQECLGASDVAMGDARPDNAQAIAYLQRAAAIPSELLKEELHDTTEDLFRIFLEFMISNYGKRKVSVPTTDMEREAMAFANSPVEEEKTVEFDFSTLSDLPLLLKMEAGASSYYSEIAAIQTLDNLLLQGKITTAQYLKRLPASYIPDKTGLIAELEAAEQAPMMLGSQALPTTM